MYNSPTCKQRKMESLKKFSEDIAAAEIKKRKLHEIMGRVKLECQNVDDHSRMMKDLFTKYSSEFESKEKLLKESHIQSHQRSDLEKSVQEGLKKLDEKERFLIEVLQEIDEKKSQVGIMRDSIDIQLKEIILREQQYHSCFEELKLVQTQVERKANELDSVEESLRIRAEEVDSRVKMLDARENEADEKEQILQERQNKLDARDRILEVREKEVDSKVKNLARKEKEGRESIQSRRRLLEAREKEMDSELERIERKKFELLKIEDELKQRFSDINLKLDSRKKSLGSKSSAKPSEVVKDRGKRCFNSAISDADRWMKKDGSDSNQGKVILYCEASNGQLKIHHENSGKHSNPTTQIQNEVEARKFEVSAEPAQGICIEEYRRDSGDGLASEVFMMDSQRQDGKRQCLREGLTEPPPNPQNSGSKVNLETQASQNVVIDEESESSLHNCQSYGKFNVGDVWCCFDLKDNLPRSQVQITRISVDRDGKVMLKVTWLKPCPVYVGEKKWVDSHLPVTCRFFKCSRASIESPDILSHPASFSGNGPWTVIPRSGETWAVYKDWDISTWSSNPRIHGNCNYEIVEIVSKHRDGSSPSLRVACLNKVPGSLNSFECISYERHSFLIERSDLYRFSHRVPSVKNDCIDANGIPHRIFELDRRSLPSELFMKC